MEESRETPVKQLPLPERPREKALQYGVENLADSELLAILLGFGGKGNSSLSIAKSLLARFGDLRKISMCTLAELTSISGIGPVKAIEIKACLEIARRFQRSALIPGEKLPCSGKVFEHFHELLRDEKREKFFAVFLDSKRRILKKELISMGSLDTSIVHPREVFCPAIREAASSILLVHNHPSGDPTPSQEDIHITKRLVQVGKLVGIEVVDHIIIGNGCYTSLLEQSFI